MTACGNLLDTIQDDARFDPIKKQFVKDAKLFGKNPDISNLRIAFGDTDKDLKYAGFITVSKGDGSHPDGYCQILKSDGGSMSPIQKIAYGNKYNMKVIVISQKFKNASLEFLETLVYHELGHCVLGYGHRPDSVMGSEVAFMGASRYFWLKELFTRQPIDYNLVIRKIDLAVHDLEPVYKVDYAGFNENISQQLFFDKAAQQYYTIDNLVQNPVW